MTPSTSPPASQRAASASPPPQDRPERSRNAKAQARHRAKRKAYIEQLEQTVTKLQSVLALSPEQVAAIPPPLIRIRELEQENELLRREVDELRRQLDVKGGPAGALRNGAAAQDAFRRDAYTPALPDDRHFDGVGVGVKRRRTADTIYTSSAHNGTTHSPPPPLSIPSITGQYSPNSPPQSAGYGGAHQSQSAAAVNNGYGGGGGARGLAGYAYSNGVAPAYAPNGLPPATPTSSATSSPSFSASPSDYASSQTLHTHAHHQRALATSYGHNALPSFSHQPSQYELVKLEDEQHYTADYGPFGTSLDRTADADPFDALPALEPAPRFLRA
ncbi:uncharacterized protein BXZ73DRAFT_102252 [Epithele typhae]|uniref:uncharacterized protein n=1 Tax=Epithele typhae TaxID=378194 RepID=UPI00200771C8|nr:uncharacterized protein BXZ73DRAFT_102252 [Epithele typhae]KAH9929098.1 hypothetical protein BXZ73DRAFT_102252 [Epithele typhae]